MRYLVTGATGLVGGEVVDRLLARGDSVRVLAFEPGAAEQLGPRGVDVRGGNLAGTADLSAVVDGVDAIVHCAGVVQMAAARSDLWAVNVEGTKRLLAAAVGAGSPRFVYLSSVAVYGHARAPITEDAAKRPVGAYGESKCAAEEALWRCHLEHGLPAVALRPCPIYGARDRKITQALRHVGRMRVLPLPRSGGRLVDLVHVSDVAEAALAASTAAEATGRAYNITDGERHTYRDILLAFERITGRRPAILPIPGRALVLAVQLGMRWRQARGVPGDWAGQVGRARGLDLDAHYAIDAARRDLGYRPKVGLLEGLELTLAGDTPAQPLVAATTR
jgi:nucleoside-diphosphate-sugar epimerase